MKKLVFALFTILGVTVFAAAQGTENLTLKASQQKTAGRTGVKVRFISVAEDSRCPAGTNCIWSGNARVRFEMIIKGGKRKTFEANTTAGPKGDQLDGWAVQLVSLTPAPRMNATLDPQRYIAKITVTRLQR